MHGLLFTMLLTLAAACSGKGERLAPDTDTGTAPDEDGDGYTVADGDWDDADAEVHPDAEDLLWRFTDCDGTHSASLSRAKFGFVGGNTGNQAGYSVSGAGDVDGDGLGNLLVGAFGKDDRWGWRRQGLPGPERAVTRCGLAVADGSGRLGGQVWIPDNGEETPLLRNQAWKYRDTLRIVEVEGSISRLIDSSTHRLIDSSTHRLIDSSSLGQAMTRIHRPPLGRAVSVSAWGLPPSKGLRCPRNRVNSTLVDRGDRVVHGLMLCVGLDDAMPVKVARVATSDFFEAQIVAQVAKVRTDAPETPVHLAAVRSQTAGSFDYNPGVLDWLTGIRFQRTQGLRM